MTIVDIIISVTREADNGQSAQEGHQLILDDDEQFIGLGFVYTSDSNGTITLPSQ